MMTSVAFAGARVSIERMPELVAVALVYGDPVVGRALATLLQGIGYDVRSIGQAYLEDPGEMPALLYGVQVLVLAPGVGARQRKDLLTLLRHEPSTTNIRVMDLNLPYQGSPVRADHHLPWPVRTEDLKRHIEEALAGGHTDGYEPSRQDLQTPEEKKEGP